MPSNLSRRVDRLESEKGGSGRMMHVIDLPNGFDHDSVLAELGIEKGEGLVVFLVDPTGCKALRGAKPKLLYSKPI
jgi:hypothetical protein